jgi:outer membrane protein OmpA-like peptidoglycan-associated protein
MVWSRCGVEPFAHTGRATLLAARCLLPCILPLAMSSIVLAEPRDSSWFTPAPGVDSHPPEPSASAEPRPRRLDRDSVERAAARALDAARRDLADGQSEIARRLLEALIARYPDAPSSDEARRDLYALYRGDTSIAGRPAASSADPRAAPQRDVGRTQMLPQQALQAALSHEVGDRIFFSAGSAAIGTRSRFVLQAQADWLARHPDLVVRIEGHADDARAGADDDAISRQRAEAVRGALIDAGVEPARLFADGVGARDPIAKCEPGNYECAAQNRRVLLHLLAPSAVTAGARQQTGPQPW